MPGAPKAAGAGRRGMVGAMDWLIGALLCLAAAAGLLAGGIYLHEDAHLGALLLLDAVSMLLLSLAAPLRVLRGWRLANAAGRWSAGAGAAELSGWPGVRERRGRLVVRRLSHLVLFWSFPLGFALSAAAFRWMGGGQFRVADLLVSLALAVALPVLALAWGPSGWKLTVDGATQNATLLRFRPFRGVGEQTTSLPTVQRVTLADDPRGRAVLTVHLTKGRDWSLDLPADWPPELSRALAARVAHLAGVECGIMKDEL